MSEASKIKHNLVADFDGDGFVARAIVITGGLSPFPTVRLEIDGGLHRSAVDLNPADLAEMCRVLETARKAATKARAASEAA